MDETRSGVGGSNSSINNCSGSDGYVSSTFLARATSRSLSHPVIRFLT